MPCCKLNGCLSVDPGSPGYVVTRLLAGHVCELAINFATVDKLRTNTKFLHNSVSVWFGVWLVGICGGFSFDFTYKFFLGRY